MLPRKPPILRHLCKVARPAFEDTSNLTGRFSASLLSETYQRFSLRFELALSLNSICDKPKQPMIDPVTRVARIACFASAITHRDGSECTNCEMCLRYDPPTRTLHDRRMLQLQSPCLTAGDGRSSHLISQNGDCSTYNKVGAQCFVSISI